MDMTEFSEWRSRGQDGYVVRSGKAELAHMGKNETVLDE